jgi:ATPase subunit of ABC transporter with duplicated ATPase domains
VNLNIREQKNAQRPTPNIERRMIQTAVSDRRLQFSAMLTVSQLSKSFGGRALFNDVSLQVNRGAANGWWTTRISLADDLSR